MTDALLLHYLSGFPRAMLPALLVFFLPLQKRRGWYLSLPLLVGLLAGCIGVGMALAPLTGEAGYMYYFGFHYILVILCCAVAFRAAGADSWTEAFYCAVFTYICEHILYCVSSILDYLLGGEQWRSGWYMDVLLPLIVYGLIYLLFSRRICRQGHYPSTVTGSVGLLVSTFFLMYLVSIQSDNLGLRWLHGLYTLISCGFIMVSEARSIRQLETERELAQKEQLWRLNKTQYEMTKENIEIINRKCHDLRHQMTALRTIAGEQEKETAIRSMEEAVQIYDTAFRTGNQSLDTVLMQKGLVCRQEEIDFSVIADGRLLSFIDPVDLFTMMANILDNAIEANQKIEDRQRRSLHLSIHEKKGLAVIQSENPFEGEIKMENGFPVTSKQDAAWHGIGTKSIAATAERYGGSLHIHTEGGMYVLRLVFPLPE
ncbi:MAG: GHKL domain-containing protein [Clostridia bacterium]|nr:GHKL domain-containing protein [Clostridia bacterium]